jgi:hypothetical protein
MFLVCQRDILSLKYRLVFMNHISLLYRSLGEIASNIFQIMSRTMDGLPRLPHSWDYRPWASTPDLFLKSPSSYSTSQIAEIIGTILIIPVKEFNFAFSIWVPSKNRGKLDKMFHVLFVLNSNKSYNVILFHEFMLFVLFFCRDTFLEIEFIFKKI